jgi:hypothetical protein
MRSMSLYQHHTDIIAEELAEQAADIALQQQHRPCGLSFDKRKTDLAVRACGVQFGFS